MRIATCVFFLSFLICCSSCVGPTAAKPNQDAETAKWDYERISGYMANVPGIRKMESWNDSGGQGVCIETEHYRIFTTLMDPLMLRQAPSFGSAPGGHKTATFERDT